MFGYIEEFEKELPSLYERYGSEFKPLVDKWNGETPYFKEIMFEEARQTYDELYESLPNTVRLYRMIGVFEESSGYVQNGGRGLHWAYDTEGMAQADKNCDISNVFDYILVVEGETPRDNIDWDAVFLYILDGYGEEHELRVKDKMKVDITKSETMTSKEFRRRYW